VPVVGAEICSVICHPSLLIVFGTTISGSRDVVLMRKVGRVPKISSKFQYDKRRASAVRCSAVVVKILLIKIVFEGVRCNRNRVRGTDA
jgi:hypothetical protein